jgi:hypothetical protein
MNLEILKTKFLADPEVKAHYDALKPEFDKMKSVLTQIDRQPRQTLKPLQNH